jgi:predicted lipoprotein
MSDGERRVALRETTEQVILPTYTELSDKTAELAALLDELVAGPQAFDLGALRAAYLVARAPLKEADAFGFGPAVELGASAALDQSPVDASKIDAELSSDADLTVAHLRSLGANKRGLHAIEYLLFPADDAELEAALLSPEASGERRRQFAAAAGSIVAEEAEELRRAWAPGDGDYASRFSQPGGADSVSREVQAGLDTLLNETVVLIEGVANLKLGRPLGVATGGKIAPETQESERASASLSDMLANLRGIRNIYLGTRDGSVGTSLSSLVHAKSPSVDVRVRAALADTEAALRAIPEPFTTALEEEPGTVQAAYDTTKALKRVLATEALGTLGASLKFSDNDGD